MSQMLNTSEIAERIGVGISTVISWVDRGEFPNAVVIPVGSRRTIRVPEADVEAFIERCRATQEPA